MKMFFVMYRYNDEANLATSKSFTNVEDANKYANGVHPMNNPFVVSTDKKDHVFDGKCFVLYTNSDGKIDNISRQEFDSWELAENYANGINKEKETYKAMAVGSIN